MAMNPNHQNYSSPSRLQRLEVRRNREKSADAFTSTLEQIDLLRNAGNPSVESDPLEYVDRLKMLGDEIFTEIPKEFQVKTSLQNEQYKIESRVRPELGNGTFDAVMKDRPSTATNGRLSVVNKDDPPLRLSYDALRIKGKIPKTSMTSQYSGLFSQNSAVNPNVEQGPVPDIYIAHQGNKREKLEERRKKFKDENIIIDRNRKARLLEPHKLNLLGTKCSADSMIPAACVLNVGTRRQEVAEKKAVSTHGALSQKPFR